MTFVLQGLLVPLFDPCQVKFRKLFCDLILATDLSQSITKISKFQVVMQEHASITDGKVGREQAELSLQMV